jgi:hypothetical protein
MKLFIHKIKTLAWIILLYLRRWLHLSPRLSKTQLINALKAERDYLEAMINSMDEAEMVKAGTLGAWSLKDMLAHIATWDKRGTTWIGVAAQGKIPEMPVIDYTWDDKDELNHQTWLENKDKPLENVLADFNDAYQRLLEQVEQLSEQQAIKPLTSQLIAWRGGHYRSHGKQICEWIQQSPQVK